MPEIKNNFLQGKMNKDLDERLLPNGQYRDAMNIEVSASEGSNVGTVQNILGNHRVENLVGNDFNCVGSVADEKTNRIYWFISKYNVDAIVEYDIDNNIASAVLVDKNAGNYKAVLKFSGNIITGINIIDGLLFWTDNNSEPKKININECKKGTIQDGTLDNHTQISFDQGGFKGLTLDKVSNNAPGNDFLTHTPKAGRYFWASRDTFLEMTGGLDIEGNNIIEDGFQLPPATTSGGYFFKVRHYRKGKFLGIKIVRFFGNTLEETDAYQGSSGNANNGTSGRLAESGNSANISAPFTTDNDFHVGDIFFGDGINLDIEERHITVIRPKPLNSLSVKVNHEESLVGPVNIPNLFETKFPRFSYRYKYRDGEYSAFAPFTTPVFNPKYTKDTSETVTGNTFYNKDNAYDIKEPYNKAMVNSIHSVELSGFVSAHTPEDVVEIDILYKQEESTVIYSINTIRHSDKEWHIEVNVGGHNVGYNEALSTAGSGNPNVKANYLAIGSDSKGKYIVTTENIHAALPANQLLRPWDNVPRKALAQEVTGNRVVYGNYVQNYELGSDVQISVDYSDRKNNIGSFASQGLPSVKSQRNYQVGIIYCDKFGRETPVFTSSSGAVGIPWQSNSGDKNASRSLQLQASVVNNFPSWVDSFKLFIKENSNEYYNLVMDRAWLGKSTYDLDDSEGHLWISFPSSDRNKISEDDYIILKKKIGPSEEQVGFENKYKVIDIQNEAPEAIRYQLISQGVVNNYGQVNGDVGGTTGVAITRGRLTDATNGVFSTHPHYSPHQQNDVLIVGIDGWQNQNGWKRSSFVNDYAVGIDGGGGNSGGQFDHKDLYVSWRRYIGGNRVESKKYEVIGGWRGTTGYVMKLKTKITKTDADIAHIIGNSDLGYTAPTGNNNIHAVAYSGAQANRDERNPEELLHEDLLFQIHRKEPRPTEDFSGKFFVKISKNQVTDFITNGNLVDITDQFRVLSANPIWAWADDRGTTSEVDSANYGIMNYNGVTNLGNNASTNVNNWIQSAVNNSVGDVAADTTQASSGKLYVSDYSEVWNGILGVMNTNNQTDRNRFFIDMMHMAAAQSDTSDYAKYCCITWSGCTKNDNGDTLEDSAWSYPPLKTWVSDIDDSSDILDALNSNSVWYNDNFISTSTLLSGNVDYNNLKIDGWVGPLQKVSRDTPPIGTGINNANHVNGLEGLVTVVADHITGPRRWFSGINGSDEGVGVDTKVYSEVGKHFMHLSFFAPGQNLVNESDIPASGLGLYGASSWAANLQGIWGGGVFTGEKPSDLFGNGTTKHFHFPMEGNYDSSNNVLMESPGPGVGYGYDLKYKELHDRQWDPTFGYLVGRSSQDEIRKFTSNIHAGARFRFNRKYTPNSSLPALIDDTIYTIKNVTVKKLYNHTSWRKPYNRFINGTDFYLPPNGQEHFSYRSVEEQGMMLLNDYNDSGVFAGTSGSAGNYDLFKKKLAQFGAAHNRRLCYIIELDKNPGDSTSSMGNPLSLGDSMNADLVNDNYCDIEFLDPVKDVSLYNLDKHPAIWEIDPRKTTTDLDIYYETGNSIPVKLNSETNELLAPVGCRVEVINSMVTGSSTIISWNNNVATFHPGLPKEDGSGAEINYSGLSFKFIRNDGSYTIIEAGQQDLEGISITLGELKRKFIFREDVGDDLGIGLNWYNCFSFGNGVESNRVKDDFNEVFITNGVKASTTTHETYKEERRKSGLIYSGIYNSNSGVNDLNQFIMAEKITKDLNPTYGSIQKLFQRRISLIAFCEDRVIQITSNKDAIYNADGNPQLISSNNVLGDANPFVGDYGISKNPESFASESYRAYFADRQRGTVLRLSKDGLTPISKIGMHDWFRDNLPRYNTILGTYDSYKEDYNITLGNNPDFSENLVLDEVLELGEESTTTQLGTLNRLSNHQVANGNSLQYLYDTYSVIDAYDSNNPFYWANFNEESYNLTTYTTIIHHAEIPYEYFQNQQNQSGGITTITQAQQDFAWATFMVKPDNPSDPNTIDGWWYDPRFTSNSAIDIWGASASNAHDAQVNSTIERFIEDFSGTIHSINENDTANESTLSSPPGTGSWAIGFDPSVAKYAGDASASYYRINSSNHTGLRKISSAITRNSATNAILFDRCHAGSYIKFRSIGSGGIPINSGLNERFVQNGGTVASGNIEHDSFFNGDELHIQFEVKCYITTDDPDDASATDVRYGYNYIEPQLTLWDGEQQLDGDVLSTYDNYGVSFGGIQSVQDTLNPPPADPYNPYKYLQTQPNAMGNDFETPNGLSGYSSNTSQAHVNYKCVGIVQSNSNTVTFPNTSNISALTQQSTNDAGTKIIVYGATFKFIDPDQQAPNGVYNGNGYGTTNRKVVNDLRFRIRNIAAPYGGSNSNWNKDYAGQSGDYPLKRPMWEINNIKIKKGFGITGPHTPFQAEETSTTPVIPALPAIPATTILPWTEVTMSPGLVGIPFAHPTTGEGWVSASPVGHNKSFYAESMHDSGFGGTVLRSALQTATLASGATVSWYEPDTTATSAIPNNWATGFTNQTANIPSPNAMIYDRTENTNHTIPTPTLGPGGGIQDYNNDWILMANPNDMGSYNHAIHMQINPNSGTSDPFVAGSWYLVDVEWDESFGAGPIAGQSLTTPPGPEGVLFVNSVAGPSSYVDLADIDQQHGVGIYRYGNNTKGGHIQLKQVYRTEYGSPRNVLRALFKVESDAPVVSQAIVTAINPHNNVPNNVWAASFGRFVLEMNGCTDKIKIEKIICRKLGTGNSIFNNWNDITTGSGIATNWIRNYVSNTNPCQHALDNKFLYFANGRLCFELPDPTSIGVSNWSPDPYMTGYGWEQDLATTIGTALEASPTNWKLSFTVTSNPVTNNFSGKLQGAITTSDATAIASSGGVGFCGVNFSGITQEGNYLITFNFDDTDNANWTFERANLGQSDYTDYTGTGSLNHGTTWQTTLSALPAPTGALYAAVGPNGSFADKLYFYNDDEAVANEYGISNISLTDSTPIFSGGSVGSWSFGGFNTSLNDFIHWDASALHLVFSVCPPIDSNTPEFRLININQQLDKTINRYEKYRINFTHGLQGGGATLSIYYYNAEGFGFKISGIDENSPNIFTAEVTIGGDVSDYGSQWQSTNPVSDTYEPDLKNSFVIQVEGGIGTSITGYIDNISMLRVIDTAGSNIVGALPIDRESTTLSFNENSKGWTSFKSFIPENGLSVSKKYFTFDDGALYQHYVPKSNGSTVNEIELADNYNVFYGEFESYSSVQVVLNQEPSVVKLFNTINYEGNQAYVTRPTALTVDGVVIKTAEEQININNSKAWNTGNDINGWTCSEVKTNLEQGSIKEFIKKEGKWFNYIKGLTKGPKVDTSLFSVQGLGVPSTSEDVTIVCPPGFVFSVSQMACIQL